MISFKKIMQLMGFAFVVLLSFIGEPAFAKDNGQIININRNFQIAFTDLGSRVLKPGDLVKVYLSADEFVYLQVLESSVILSKLGASKVEGFQTNLTDFQRMAIGNAVSKVTAGQSKGDNSDIKNSEDTASLLQMQKMEQALNLAKEQIKQLKEVNEASKAKLDELTALNQVKKEEPAIQEGSFTNKPVAEQIKAHLEKMNKIINENN
jgi:hypothetical protein